MSTLDDLITRTNNVLGALEGLLQTDAAETPIPDTSISYTIPAIAYDEVNDAWTFTQSSADSADGLYKGLFTLALETGCSYITILSENVVTPDDGVPARYQACGSGTMTDVAAIASLNNKQINKLEIRSKQPFAVTVKLSQYWCYDFIFEEGEQGWSPAASSVAGVYHAVYSGDRWVASTASNARHAIGIRIPAAGVHVTRVEMWLVSGMNGNRNQFLVRDTSSSVATISAAGNTHPTADIDHVFNGDLEVYAAKFNVNTGTADAHILRVLLTGIGTSPFGEDNCE